MKNEFKKGIFSRITRLFKPKTLLFFISLPIIAFSGMSLDFSSFEIKKTILKSKGISQRIHPRYKKLVKSSKRFLVDDPSEEPIEIYLNLLTRKEEVRTKTKDIIKQKDSSFPLNKAREVKGIINTLLYSLDTIERELEELEVKVVNLNSEDRSFVLDFIYNISGLRDAIFELRYKLLGILEEIL